MKCRLLFLLLFFSRLFSYYPEEYGDPYKRAEAHKEHVLAYGNEGHFVTAYGVSVNLTEEQIRRRFMSRRPNSVDQMVAVLNAGGYKVEDVQFYQKRGWGECSWQSQDGTATVGVGFYTGNPVLDLLPAPARNVLGLAKFLYNIEAEWKGIKEMFGWRESVSAELALPIIKQDLYTEMIYNRIHKIRRLIMELNSNDLPTAIKARIEIMHIDLPYPYNKKFYKSMKRMLKKYIDTRGDIDQDFPRIDTVTVFDSFLSQQFDNPVEFVKYIPELNDYGRDDPRKSKVNSGHEMLHLIKNGDNWSVPQLTDYCQSSRNKLVQKLYRYYVEKKFYQNQKEFYQDPYFKAHPGNNSVEFRTHLFLRKHNKEKLNRLVSNYTYRSDDIQEELYKALENPGLQYNPTEKYAYKVVDNLLQSCCNGARDSSSQIGKNYFHESGVLKKYSSDPFVKEHFLDKKLNSKLQHAVNYALVMRGRSKSYEVKAVCHEILNAAAGSFYCSDPDFAEGLEDEAYRLARQLIANEGAKFKANPMDENDKDEFWGLSLEDLGRNEERIAAQDKTISEGFREFVEIYDLTPEIKGFMQAHYINPYIFSKVHGNHLQHQLSQELITIMARAGAQERNDFSGDIASFGSLAQNYNLLKKFDNAIVSTDICWSILKYGKAVALGLGDTAGSLINIAQDPVKYVCDTVSGVAKLTYGTLKYGHDLVLDKESARGTEEYLLNLCKALKKVYDESTGPECVRFGVHFISEGMATRRAASGLSKFLGKVVQSVRNRPAWSAAHAIESVSQDADGARRFMGDVLYYCEDEITHLKGGRCPKGILQADEIIGHRHKIANSSFVCKTATARVAVEKTPIKAIKAGKKFSDSAANHAVKTVSKTGLKSPTNFFLESQTKQQLLSYKIKNIIPAISTAACKQVKKVTTFFAFIKNRMSLRKKEAKNPREVFTKPLDKRALREKKMKAQIRELDQAIKKYSKALPANDEYAKEVAELQDAESGLAREALGEEWIVDWDLPHSMTYYIEFKANRRGIYNFDNPRVDTGHCDNEGKLENYNQGIKFLNKVERDGYYIVDISMFGRERTITKTFFPIDWRAKKTFKVVCEALKKADPYEGIPKVGNRFPATGYTKSGAKIQFILERVDERIIKVVTFYPCEEWVKESLDLKNN